MRCNIWSVHYVKRAFSSQLARLIPSSTILTYAVRAQHLSYFMFNTAIRLFNDSHFSASIHAAQRSNLVNKVEMSWHTLVLAKRPTLINHPSPKTLIPNHHTTT